ncbi:hypothetical protein [Microvirga sp. G4-2]|uniref:hypothetical protein n=1 Tax=Microvirga sp. G4-2 TaxID=3434467 RepID=UPI00404483D4
MHIVRSRPEVRISEKPGSFSARRAMYPRIEIPDEKRRQAYADYVSAPELSVSDIAASLGVSISSFYRLKQRWAWPPRLAALAENELSKATKDRTENLTGSAAAATSLREAARSLARATRIHINALMEKQRSEGIEDHDGIARTLASYAKTLTTVRALLEQEGSTLDGTEHQDETPRSLHELRDELARHLERVIAEEEARGSDGLLI